MESALAEGIVKSLSVSRSRNEPLARLNTFSERDWRQTLPWLDDSGLALYLLERVNRSSSPPALPAEIEACLRWKLASNQERVAAMKAEFGALNRRFEEAGVEYAVLKGFALIPEFCADAALRSQYDYDYLVPPGSVSLAQHTLQAAGYSQKVKSPGREKQGESLFVAQPLSLPSADENFYSAHLSRSVELHLSLWESHRDMIDVEIPGDALKRRRWANWDGLQFPVLAEDDALLFQTLHAFAHIVDYWCRPSCFLEIAYSLARRHSDRAFWDQFRLRVGNHKNLAQIVGLVFSIAVELFEAPIPAEVNTWLAETVPASLPLWVRQYGRRWALARFPGSKLSLFVHREFIDDRDAWREVLWGRLFPFHRPARVVESVDSSLSSRWRTSWDHGRFVFSRLKHHLNALLGYSWELPRWKRTADRLQRGDY